MGEDEPDEPMREAVLVRECQQAAQHQSIEGNHVERTEAEEDLGAERAERHHDVVAEDSCRQQPRWSDAEELVGPEVSVLDAIDHAVAGDDADECRIGRNQSRHD